ncbi:serine protease [Candidatus Uabimicrobium sp. HlEnr_7]|uniref:trypsin-like serine peptidase n=1 Tax=Candidatus Uabimicrobium helgolandensis TaxID=3095367 RepID=UPI003557AE7D
MKKYSIIKVVEALTKYFSDQELENIASELLEDYSSLVGGKSKYEYASSLVVVVEKRLNIDLLVNLAKKLNSKFNVIESSTSSNFKFTSGKVFEAKEILTGDEITFREISFLKKGIEVAESVGIIRTPEGLGSGFLISKNLIMTNHHVLKNRDIALSATVEFDYEQEAKKTCKVCRVIDYIWSNESLDVAILEIEQKLEIPFVKFCLQNVKVGQQAFIIGHPNGETKQMSLGHNEIIHVGYPEIHYLTDTLRGSSGSPVFNKSWEVIGIHHRGYKEEREGDLKFYNKGSLATAIKNHWADFNKYIDN